MKKFILLLTLLFSFTLTSFANYEENSDCVDCVVVYEGRNDYYIIETREGFTILECYGVAYLDVDDVVRGPLNRYNFQYIINKRTKKETRVYIEDYMMSKEAAINWMKEHDKLK